MTTPPLVSVITPFLDAEAYFEEAIKSVVAQTYAHWELLLVDDGSTDSSTQIAKSYSARYPDNIRYLEHDGHCNLGKSTSRNLGIHQARGDYIALLDADDMYHRQKLEKQLAIFKDHPEAGMVYGPTLYWYSWTGHLKDQQRDRIAQLGIKANTLVYPPHLLTLFLRNGGVVPCTCGLMVRRDVVMSIGGFDEAIQHMYEDQVFIAKACLMAPVFVEEGCWDKYRQHEASSSAIAIRNGEYHPYKLNPVRLVFLKWLGDYVGKQGCKDARLWRAYHDAMWYYEHPRSAKIILSSRYLVKRLFSLLN